MTSHPSGAPLVPLLTYEPFYGLKEKAFSLSADPRFLYESPAYAGALDHLLAGIRRREGPIVVTGEVGTGRTTLCRAALERLDGRTFSTFVHDPFLTREDLIKALLVGVGAMSPEDLQDGRLERVSRQDLSHLLYDFLDSLAALHASALLVLDEAQNLSLPVIEEIRILSARDPSENRLQIVLVGQPALRDILKRPELRQIDQRVSVRCELISLDAAGVEAYVSHRLSVAAGAEGCHARFSRPGLAAMTDASRGLPRLVNLICDRALRSACAAKRFDIDAETVRRAITEVETERGPTRRSPRRAALEGLDAFGAAEDREAPLREMTLENLPGALREFPSEPAPIQARARNPRADRDAAREVCVRPLFEHRPEPSSRVVAAIACWLAFLVIGLGLWYLSVSGERRRTTGLRARPGESRGSTEPGSPPRTVRAGVVERGKNMLP